MSDHVLVLVSCGDSTEAELIARHLVEASLAAGGQLLPIKSIYTWKDEIVNSEEVLLIVKTRTAKFEEIELAVMRLHSYEVPQIVAIPIVAGSLPYLDWIDGVVGR